MLSGSLNRRVIYQTQSSARDDLGQPVISYTSAGTHWARITSPSGKELMVAGQLQAQVSHVLTLRYPGFNFDTKSRFLFGTRIFNITGSVNVEERNRTVTVFATEQVSPTPT